MRDISSPMLKMENDSIMNISEQYNNVIVNIYFAYTPSPNERIDGSGFVKSSSRGKYSRNILRRIIAIIVQAKAFIPCVSENMSMKTPIIKDVVNIQLVDNETGSFIIKYINTRGIATLNRHKLLNMITCAKIIIMNKTKKCIIVLLI